MYHYPLFYRYVYQAFLQENIGVIYLSPLSSLEVVRLCCSPQETQETNNSMDTSIIHM
jgi:hypothetical protein